MNSDTTPDHNSPRSVNRQPTGLTWLSDVRELLALDLTLLPVGKGR